MLSFAYASGSDSVPVYFVTALFFSASPTRLTIISTSLPSMGTDQVVCTVSAKRRRSEHDCLVHESVALAQRPIGAASTEGVGATSGVRLARML